MPRVPSILALMIFSACAAADDWPQWLGPQRDGSTSEQVMPWKEPPKVLWRIPVGEGHSSPVVANGRVFLHAKVKDKDDEEVISLEAQTSKQAWRVPYPRGPFSNIFGVGPRGTPLVANGLIYTYGVTGILTCFDADQGRLVWQVDALKELQAANLFFGASCSPIVLGKNILINVGGRGASIVAFDAKAGTVAWKSQDDKASYSSPIRVAQDKTDAVVFLTGERLIALKPADGAQVWDFPLADKLFESSVTPVRVGNMLMASSITYGSVGLKLESKDGKPAVEQAWKDDKLTCYFSSPVAVGKDHVYMVTGSSPLAKKHIATLRCIEAATGKVLWSKSPVGEYHASLVRTGDDKLLLLDDSGNLMLLEPNAREYRELARAKVCGKTWAHPALANGKLYIRDEKELICVQVGE